MSDQESPIVGVLGRDALSKRVLGAAIFEALEELVCLNSRAGYADNRRENLLNRFQDLAEELL